jgi:hypothetical protein
MWTLTLCVGMFMGICGQLREASFPDRESCERERAYQAQRVGTGYAVCAPTSLRSPK